MADLSDRYKAIVTETIFKLSNCKTRAEYIANQLRAKNYDDALNRSARLIEEMATVQNSILHAKWEDIGCPDPEMED